MCIVLRNTCETIFIFNKINLYYKNIVILLKLQDNYKTITLQQNELLLQVYYRPIQLNFITKIRYFLSNKCLLKLD